jgi:DNA-directed RNA polymerase
MQPNEHGVYALHDRQRASEQEAIESGRQRFVDAVAKAKEAGRGSDVGALAIFLSNHAEVLIEAFQREFDQIRHGARPSVLQRYLLPLGAETCGVVSLMVVANYMLESTPKDRIGREITARLLGELRAQRLKKEARGLFEYKMRDFKGSLDFWHQSRSMWSTLKWSEVDLDGLEPGDAERTNLSAVILTLIGSVLVPEIIEENVIYSRRESKRTSYWRANEDVRVAIRGKDAELAMLAPPRYRPLLIPPQRWSNEEPGGYWYSLRGELEITTGLREWQRREIREHDLTELHRALNGLQETPWRVNKNVIEVANHLKARGGEVAKIPRLEPMELAPWPEIIPFERRGEHTRTHEGEQEAIEQSDDPEAVRAALAEYRREAKKLKEKELARASDAKTFLMLLSAAWDYEDVERFWFAWQTDWRGRLYPVSGDSLHPHGPDVARGLLEFAEGTPIGDGDGPRWLAISLANNIDDEDAVKDGSTVKLSKLGYDERVAWVEDHEEMLRATAADPYTNKWWHEADKPFQTLATVLEWVGYLDSGRSADYETHVVCSVDGAANAYQHYSATWADEHGAAMTNMIDAERPVDVYTMVADAALDYIREAHATDPDEDRRRMAGLVLDSGIVSRSLAKTPAVSGSYGSRKTQWPRTLEKTIRKKDGDLRVVELIQHFGDTQGWYEARVLISDAFHQSMTTLMPKAMAGLEYYRGVAKALASENRPVAWVNPFTNYPVRQANWKSKRKQSTTTLNGKKAYRQSYRVPLNKLDKTKQADGLAANVTHGRGDSTHLAMTLSELWLQHGLTNLYAVHDSVGAPPAQLSILQSVLRSTFVTLYSEPLLERFHEGVVSQITDADKLPECPAKGTWNVAEVVGAPYFFG